MQPATTNDSDYTIRLDLECDPFAAGAMPEFFFVGAQRRFLVQRTVHALYFSGSAVLLIGVNGGGKTRSLTEIEKELKDLTDICHIDATVLMDATEIRGALAESLGLPRTVAMRNVELVHALEQVRPVDGDPQPVLISVDAAQLLSIETLAECAGLVASAGGRLRLLLAGEADLITAWQQAHAGPAEILELKLLDRSETEDYVRTKLQAAGYRGEQPLSISAFDRLFTQSGGNFAAINVLAPQLLQPEIEAVTVVRRIKTFPILHICIAAVLLAIVIVLLLYRNGSSSSSTEAQSQQLSLPTTQLTATQTPQTRPQQSTANLAPPKKNGVEQSSVALQLPGPSTETVEKPNAVEAAPQQSNQSPINASTENKIASQPASVETKNVAPKEIAEKPVAPQPTEKREKTAPSTSSPVFNADENALLGFPASQYVLQLMGAESRSTVDKFAASAGRGLKFYCYRTKLHGKPWFIVVAGPYANKNAAQTELNKLPEEVRKQQPWPRTLANVQADIRAHANR